MGVARIAGDGWLVLIGGGEFSFEETEAADGAWLGKLPVPAEAPVAFLPTASGSQDYANHFAVYLDEYFERACETVPVFRGRDVRRARNLERLAEAPAVYLGGGVVDQLLETVTGSPTEEALAARLRDGGVVVAIAAAAQACGTIARGLRGGRTLDGFGWLPGGVVETNFEPGHDRRLRRLLGHPKVSWGVGLPAGSALLLGPGGAVETVGPCYLAHDANGPLTRLDND